MFRISRIHLFTLGFVLSTFLSTAAMAQGAAAPAGGSTAAGSKIAIVNIQEAIFITNEGKKEFDALQTRYGPKNNELKSQGEEIDKLKTQLQAQQDKLNEEARAAQVKAITDKQKVWQRNAEDFQAEVQQAFQDYRATHNVLFRLEATALGQRPTVLVQSTSSPDWSALPADWCS